MPKDKSTFPLVYSCSGCSSAAQMANHIALALDRLGTAEMSCIAGVGGDVPSLVRLARSGRPVAVIDGCPLLCARSCLARHGVDPDMHWQLGEHGVRKRYHAGFDPEQAEAMVARVAGELEKLDRKRGPAPAAAPVCAAGADSGARAPALS
ncbi:putative zinc-binding protein [Massilia sp. BSC265]|uniref:putative zinc-binding protein n=1 Tax=Massilia sp. BSC265 TaxID=1549812 RepID=UPI0004E97D65|nr:putative zinc-binding protein [Massilia sp. BSC265]KFI08335.1 zinc-binding protein [Massilia sp. BSC265]